MPWRRGRKGSSSLFLNWRTAKNPIIEASSAFSIRNSISFLLEHFKFSMEVPEMENRKNETQLTSAAAFVEGGIQDSCDDACSICLEEFCESDPSTVTTCKHEFHLQCILEWCQRSSHCPMCWQSISLMDPTSQELLEAVEQERSLRIAASRNAAIFYHPALSRFGLQRLPIGVNNADIEELIIQRLAAAAAMGRAPHLGRREELSPTSTPYGCPHYLVFSTQPSAPPSGPFSAAEGRLSEPAAIPVGSPSTPLTADRNEPAQHISHLQTRTSLALGSTNTTTNHQESYSNNRGSKSHSSPIHSDQAGPSENQSFSESLRSRIHSVSMRYRESISKGSRGWKERLLCRNSSMSDIGSGVRRELNAGISSVSRLMERLETRENERDGDTSMSNCVTHSSIAQSSTQNNAKSR